MSWRRLAPSGVRAAVGAQQTRNGAGNVRGGVRPQYGDMVAGYTPNGNGGVGEHMPTHIRDRKLAVIKIAQVGLTRGVGPDQGLREVAVGHGGRGVSEVGAVLTQDGEVTAGPP